MNKNLLKGAAIYIGIGVFVLVGFQNCAQVKFTDTAGDTAQSPAGDPSGQSPTTPPGNPPNNPLTGASIALVPDATSVLEGQNVLVTVNYQNVSDISYTCKDRVSGETVLSGHVSSSGEKVPVKISQDIHCEATGTATADNTPLQAQGDVAVDCGNRLKNSDLNRCEDFSCKKIVTLEKTNLDNVPKRTVEGICYAVKMFGKIANSGSDKNGPSDNEVLSRNHNSPSTIHDIHNPYILGKDNIEFRLEGPRAVKLSGGPDATTPILVDNFVVVGVYPSTQDPNTDLPSYYKAMGTSDSSIADDSGNDSHSVKLKDTFLPIQSFGVGGTSTVAPLDITTSVQPAIFHHLDLRALDCGGSKELSDIYLLFQ